jgi:hypothetical protein
VDLFNSNNLIDNEIIIKNIKNITFVQTIKQSIFKCFEISWLPPKFTIIITKATTTFNNRTNSSNLNQYFLHAWHRLFLF